MLTVYVTIDVQRKGVNPNGRVNDGCRPKTESTAKPRERLTRDRVDRRGAADHGRRGPRGRDDAPRRARGRRRGDVPLQPRRATRRTSSTASAPRVMARLPVPRRGRRLGRDRTSTARRSGDACCKSHPNVIALFAERTKPMTDLEALMPMEFALRTIRARRHDRARGRAGLQRDRRLHHGLRDDGESARMFGGGAMRRRTRPSTATRSRTCSPADSSPAWSPRSRTSRLRPRRAVRVRARSSARGSPGAVRPPRPSRARRSPSSGRRGRRSRAPRRRSSSV